MKIKICLLLAIVVLCAGCASTLPTSTSAPSPSERSSSQKAESQTQTATSDSPKSTSDKPIPEPEQLDYSHLLSSVYMTFPNNGRIDTTLESGLADAFNQESFNPENISISDLTINKGRIVPTYEVRIEDVKSNFDQISSESKLLPFIVNTNDYFTITESKAGTENGCFFLSYDETQKLFTITGVGLLDSIDYPLRHDLILNEQRKSKIEKSGIKVADAKAYFVMLDDIGWGHIITDGTTEVFLCTYRPMVEEYVSFEQLYSSKEIISFYKEILKL